MINLLNSNHSSAKSLKNNRGGYSQKISSESVVKDHSGPTVNRRSNDGQAQYAYSDSTRSIRYAALLLLFLTIGITNAWGACSDYLGDGAGGGTYSNKYKVCDLPVGCAAVNIQHPGFATADGIYLTFPAGISSCTLSNYNIQGAGIILHLSNFTAQETEVTVVYAGGSATFTVYYEDGTSGGGGDATLTFKSGEKIYLRDAENNFDFNALWKVSGNNGNVYAYFWNTNEENSYSEWSGSGDLVNGSWNAAGAVYELTVPGNGKEFTHVQFTRGNNDNHRWNKSIDNAHPDEGLNMFNMDNETSHKVGEAYNGSWAKFTPSGKTVYFDARIASDTWTTAYVRIGHGSHNSAWGPMTKVAGTKCLYSYGTSAYANHTEFSVANGYGWTNKNNIVQPWNGQSLSDGQVISKQTNYQQYAIEKNIYICPQATSITEYGCQYYTVDGESTSSHTDANKVATTLPQYTVTASGTNCTVGLVEYTNDALTTSQAITANKVDPTRYVGVTVTPSTGYEFGSVSLTSSAYEQHTAAAAGVTGKYAIMADCEISATCTPITYNITYKDQGNVAFSGSHADGYPETHTYGTATTLKTASKTGYTFGGWFANSTCTGSAVTSLGATAYTDDITLYAKWTANNYDITYKDGGDTEFSGTHEDGYPTTHTYGTATTLKSATKTGYTFEGWYTSSACTGAAVTSLGATAYTDDITLYAKWTIKTYTITLEDGGATTAVSPTSVTATYNSSSLSSAITAPVQSGYTFDGWYTGEGGKSGSKVIGTDGSLQTSVAGYTDGSGNWTHDDEVTLYAKWDVEGGGGGGTWCDYATGHDNNADWGNTDGRCLISIEPTGNTNEYRLTLKPNTAKENTSKLDYLYVIGSGNSPHPATSGTDENGNSYDEMSVVFTNSNSSVTLTIQWSTPGWNGRWQCTPTVTFSETASCEGGGTTYTVTYDDNGADDGTVPVDAFSPYLEDATVTVLGNKHDLTMDGYTFGGWNTKDDGSGETYDEDDTFTITDDVTLYAKWISASGTTITLDANTANHGVTGNQSVTAAKGSALPSFTHTTAATGYQIEGYYTTASGEGTKIINANKTLVASTTYTDESGNWNSDAENLTLYARYEPKTYTISYYDQGGSAFSGSHADGHPTSHTYGTATTLKSATKSGYNFDGWFTTTTCTGDPVTSLGATVYTADINLYAKWTDPTSCSQSGGAGSGDGEYIFATGYDLSIKRKAAVSSSNPDSLIISADSKGEGIGNIYLFFFETETSTEIFKEVQLATTASSVKTTIPIPSEMANDEYAYLSVKFEKDGGAMLTERMLFNLKEGGCEEPATTYFDIYHHDDAPVGARTSYEGGNIVVPIRYFRHFSHTDWTTITLPFEVSKVVVKEGEDEYDLYPRFNNGSSDVEGYYWLKTFNGAVTLANFQSAWQPLTVTSPGSTDSEIAANVKPAKNTPYVIAFPDGSYYSANWVIFYGDAGQTIASSFTGTSSITLTGEDYDYSKVQFVGNNTMHASGTLTNIYMIEEGYDYFTRCESASVPAFEAYVRGTEQVQRNYAILRYRGGNTPETPTDIDALPTTECRGAVYNLSGMKIATFAGRDAMEQVLNKLSEGVYIVRTGTEVNKVIVR